MDNITMPADKALLRIAVGNSLSDSPPHWLQYFMGQ